MADEHKISFASANQRRTPFSSTSVSNSHIHIDTMRVQMFRQSLAHTAALAGSSSSVFIWTDSDTSAAVATAVDNHFQTDWLNLSLNQRRIDWTIEFESFWFVEFSHRKILFSIGKMTLQDKKQDLLRNIYEYCNSHLCVVCATKYFFSLRNQTKIREERNEETSFYFPTKYIEKRNPFNRN